MRKHPLAWLLVLLLAGLLTAASLARPAAAQEQQGIILTVEAGYDGMCKEGEWIPIRVTVENNGANLEARLEASAPVAGPRQTFAYPIELPTQSRKEVFLYVFPETYLSSLEIRLVAGKEVLAQQNPRLTCLSSSNLLFGVIADNPSPFNILVELDPPNGTASIAQIELGGLPDYSQALEALDGLVISGVDTGSLSTAQRQALASWVANGGQLIVTGGPEWQKTAAGLDELLPLHPNGTRSLSSLEALAKFSSSQQPMGNPAQQVLVAVGNLSAEAQVLIEQDGLPLVAWQPVGYGGVFYLAADPALEPLDNWDGMVDLYASLFSWQADLPGWADGIQNWGAAQAAATSLPGMQIEYILLICCFLGGYVVALGPLNFLALRFLKRRELAWVSIPALVVFFSGLSFLVGGLTRGRQPVINRLAIVQVWAGGDFSLPQARVDGVVGIYAPRRAAYNIETGGRDYWLLRAIPEQYIGAPIAASRDLLILQAMENTSIADLRIEVGSIYPLVVEGMIPAPSFTGDLRLEISAQGVSLRGSISNNSSLNLKDAMLLYPGGSLSLGEFSPGETYPVDIPLVQAQMSGVPYGPSGISPFGTAYTSYSTYYNANDNTLYDIIGSSNYYDDPDLYRRYQLLAGILNNTRGRGGGVFLSGWNDQSLIGLEISNAHARMEDTTLYLVSFTPVVQVSGNVLRLTPGAFVWSVQSDSIGSYYNIYNASIYPSETHRYIYSLARPIPYRSIRSLTLHLNGDIYSGSITPPTDLEVWLWDTTEDIWVQFFFRNWGDHDIPYPERYVGPEGSIRLRLDNNGGQYITIRQADFTLEVEP